MSNQGSRKPGFRHRFNRNSEEPNMSAENSSSSYTFPCSSKQATSNPTQQELRLVLLGRTGAGKSASGNTILCDECFDAKANMGSVTRECKKERRRVEGRDLLLIDTPGIFDTDLTTEQLQHEVIRCLTLCSPGPHAFLLVIPIERYTQEQQKAVEMIQEMFRHNLTNHTIIIFSKADELKGEPIDKFLSQQNPKVQELVGKFRKRFVAFDNKDPTNRNQVGRLLEKVDELMLQNNNRPFSNDVTQVVLKAKAIIDERRMKQEQNKYMNMELCIIEEHQRRERLETKHDYTKMIICISLFMLGIGIGYAPAILAFLIPTGTAVADSSLAANILTQLLNLVVLKLPNLTRCTIQ